MNRDSAVNRVNSYTREKKIGKTLVAEYFQYHFPQLQPL